MVKLFFRDVLDRPGYSAIVIFCVVFAVVLMYCVMSYSAIIEDIGIGFSYANCGDNELTISANSLTGGTLVPTAPLENIDGVEDYVGVFESYLSYKVKDGEYTTAFVRGFEKHQLEKIHAIEYVGKMYEKAEDIREDQVIISRKFAENNGLILNSAITLVTGAKSKTVFVGGIAENEGYFYGNAETILATNICVSKLYGLSIGHLYNKVYVNASDDKVDDVMNALSIAPEYKDFMVEYSTNSVSMDSVTNAFTTGFLLCAIALVISSMLIVHKVFDAQYKTKSMIISRLKIIGARDGKVAALFFCETTTLCVIGIILGSCIAVVAYRLIVQRTTGLTPNFTWSSLLISVGTVFLMALLTAAHPIITASKQSIKECMTEAKSTDFKPSVILLSVFVLGLAICLILEFTLSTPYRRSVAAVGSMCFAIGLIITGLPFAFKAVGRLLAKSKRPISALASNELRHNKKSLSTLQITSAGTIFCLLVLMMLSTFTDYLSGLLSSSENILYVANVSDMGEARLHEFSETEGVNYATVAYKISSGSLLANGERKFELFAIDDCSRLEDIIPYSKDNCNPEDYNSILQDTSKDYIIINTGYAKIHNVKIGDELVLNYKGISHTYVIGAMLNVSDSYSHGFVNRKKFTEYFQTEPYNVVFVNTDNTSQTADRLRTTFKDDKIEVIPLRSLINLKVARNKSTIDFINVMSGFIITILVSALLCNIILGELNGERENTQLILIGVSRKSLLLRTLLHNLLSGLVYVAAIMSIGTLISYAFCDAAVIVDAYVIFKFFSADSISIVAGFFVINLFSAPVFRLLRPYEISVKQLRTL